MPTNHSLSEFLSTEESKLLGLIPGSSLTDDKKFELENIIIPSVKEDVEKVLRGYLGEEPDLRLLGDPKVLPKVMEDLGRVDWNLLGNMKKRIAVREVRWKEEMEEGYKEVVREKMKEMYSLEEWMNLKKREKGAVKVMVGGKERGLRALAGDSLFGTGGDPVSNDDAMQNLLRKIYTQEEFEAYLPGVQEKMREKYSLEEWMNLTQPEKGVVKIVIGGKEKSLEVLAGDDFFKTGGNPSGSDGDIQKLLEQIFSTEEFVTYIQMVKDQVLSRHAIDVWMNLTQEEKKEIRFTIGGKSYTLEKLATFFKVVGKPVNSDGDMKKLLDKIYTQEDFRVYIQGVKDQVQSRHTLDVWMNLSATEKREEKPFIVGGKPYTLNQLATFFKTGGGPEGNTSDMQKLLEQIFSPEEFMTYTQRIKDQIQSRHTLDVWMSLSKIEKKEESFTIGGKSYTLLLLATLFKTGGKPTHSSTDFKNLMIKIYGSEEVERYTHLLKTKPKK